MLRKNKNNSYSSEALAKTGTLISEGAVFDGNLKVPDMIRVDGTVNGNCICQKELILGPKGQIVGNVSAQSVIISGRLDGDVSVLGKLELLSSGKINGNITARSLVIDEDAYFDGRCTMTSPQSGDSTLIEQNTGNDDTETE